MNKHNKSSECTFSHLITWRSAGVLSLLQLYCLFAIVSHISTWLRKATEVSPVTTGRNGGRPPPRHGICNNYQSRTVISTALWWSNGRTFTASCGHLSARWTCVKVLTAADHQRRLWLWSVSASIVFFKISGSWSPQCNICPRKPPKRSFNAGCKLTAGDWVYRLSPWSQEGAGEAVTFMCL